MNRADFIPDVIWKYGGDGWASPVDRCDDPVHWRELVDDADAVITQVDDGKPLGGRGLTPTSSSSGLKVMATMLDILAVQRPMNVLEIGAGTGYNSALLAERVSPGHVTTIEVDPDIADHADPPAEPFTHFSAAFALGLLLPGLNVGRRPHDKVVLLSHRASSSWATVIPGEHESSVYFEGPRRLWEDLETAWRWWVDAGRPDHTRFGLTVARIGQSFWLDERATHSHPSACWQADQHKRDRRPRRAAHGFAACSAENVTRHRHGRDGDSGLPL